MITPMDIKITVSDLYMIDKVFTPVGQEFLFDLRCYFIPNISSQMHIFFLKALSYVCDNSMLKVMALLHINEWHCTNQFC